MRNTNFTDEAWDDYLYWQGQDKKTLKRINQLVESARRTPFEGIGKPEALKGNLSGFWPKLGKGKPDLVQCCYRLIQTGEAVGLKRLHFK